MNMDGQKIVRMLEREIWYVNRSMWIIMVVSLFAFSLIIQQFGATLVLGDLASLQIGLGIGVLGVIAYFAEKFPPKSLKLKSKRRGL